MNFLLVTLAKLGEGSFRLLSNVRREKVWNIENDGGVLRSTDKFSVIYNEWQADGTLLGNIRFLVK